MSGPLNLAIVCKYRNDDAIVLYSLIDQRVWLVTDYESILSELEQDDYQKPKGGRRTKAIGPS